MRKDDHERGHSIALERNIALERIIGQGQNFAVERSIAPTGYRVGREAAGEARQPSSEVRQQLEQAWALLAQLRAQIHRSRGTGGGR